MHAAYYYYYHHASTPGHLKLRMSKTQFIYILSTLAPFSFVFILINRTMIDTFPPDWNTGKNCLLFHDNIYLAFTLCQWFLLNSSSICLFSSISSDTDLLEGLFISHLITTIDPFFQSCSLQYLPHEVSK